MYGFCRLGVMPAPSGGAACVANGLATATTRNAKKVETAAKTGTTHTMRSRAQPRFRLTAAAPKLQRVLAQALEAGGWLAEVHEGELRKAAAVPGEEERLTAVRTLLAEEARMGMMVGVAVGWALADELRKSEEED